MHPITKAAYDAVAKTVSPEDEPYEFSPRKHPEVLPPEALELREVLQRESIRSKIDDYESKRQHAGPAQATYKFLRSSTIWLTCITIIFASFLAIFPPSRWASARVEFLAIMLLLGVLILLMTTMLVRGRFNTQQYWHNVWYTRRAEAEVLRRAYFEQMMGETPAQITRSVEGSPPGSAAIGRLPLLPLKLEYFARYQLEAQKAFHSSRSEELANEHSWWRRGSRVTFETLLWPTLMAIAILAVAYAPVVEQGPSSWPLMAQLSSWMQSYSETDVARVLLWLLIVFSALFAAAFTQGLVNTSGRNARRYVATLRSLQAVERAQLESARAAAVEGRASVVIAFVKAVHGIMAAEQQEWLVLTAPEEQRGTTDRASDTTIRAT
jgi:hypothetical protein